MSKMEGNIMIVRADFERKVDYRNVVGIYARVYVDKGETGELTSNLIFTNYGIQPEELVAIGGEKSLHPSIVRKFDTAKAAKEWAEGMLGEVEKKYKAWLHTEHTKAAPESMVKIITPERIRERIKDCMCPFCCGL